MEQKISISQELLDSAGSVRTVDDFKRWTKTCIRPLLPHGALLCGLGHLHAGGVNLDYLIGVDYPVGHIDAIRNRAGAIDTPILRRWLVVREPLIFELEHPWPDIPEKWLASFRHHDLRNIVVHAVVDNERCVGTYHSFYRIPNSPGDIYIETLRCLTPLLHQVLCHVIENIGIEAHKNCFTTSLAALTERESEIIRWLKHGKTNGEIGRIVALSESTIKHHLTHIFTKLQVSSRTQLMCCLTEHELRNIPKAGTKVL